MKAIIYSNVYQVFRAFLIVMSVGLFIMEIFWMTTTEFEMYSLPWVIAAIAGNALFCVDLIVHAVVHGCKRLYSHKPEYILETVLQVAAFGAAATFFATGVHARATTCKVFAIIVLFRMLRLMTYFYELYDFQMIIDTFNRFSTPFAVVLCSLYTVCFEFAVIG